MSYWQIIDSRTGRPAQMSVYSTRERAEESIAQYRERDARGGRPDIHDLIPHLDTEHVDTGRGD